MSISDQLLMAYADGELSPEQRDAMDAAVALDPALAERLQAHLRLRTSIGAAFADVIVEPVPDRLLRAANLETASNIVPLRPKASPPLRWWGAAGGLIAASLAVGIFVSPAFRSGDQSPIGPDMAARGALAHALDTQLASTQGAAPVRIGLTFRSTDGQVCRTFQIEKAGGASGLACRETPGWQVRMAVPAGGSAEPAYRTASSATPVAVTTLVQSLISGAVMDAHAERDARDRHWRP